jgi:hypothetical protein
MVLVKSDRKIATKSTHFMWYWQQPWAIQQQQAFAISDAYRIVGRNGSIAALDDNSVEDFFLASLPASQLHNLEGRMLPARSEKASTLLVLKVPGLKVWQLFSDGMILDSHLDPALGAGFEMMILAAEATALDSDIP